MLNAYRRLYLGLLRLKAPEYAGAPAEDRFANRGASAGHTRPDPHAVRGANATDLAGIVAIHEKAFSEFFLTRLGSEFLCRYYELVLGYQSGIVLTTEKDGALAGFVCGFMDPPEFYRLMWRNRKTFMLPAMSALTRHPSLSRGMLSGIQRIQSSAAQAQPRSCELASIAVAPDASGNGVGMSLVRAFLDRSWSMNARYVSLTTDADGNDAANALYNNAGFQLARRFLQRKGRWMNEYVIARAADPYAEIHQ